MKWVLMTLMGIGMLVPCVVIQAQDPPAERRRGDEPKPKADEPKRKGEQPPREGGERRRDGDDRLPPRDDIQIRRPMGPGGMLAASGKFVYVLRGDELLQFDGTTLELVKRVRMPSPEPPPRERD